MSLNEIQLPTFLVYSLYKDSLVIDNKQPDQAKASQIKAEAVEIVPIAKSKKEPEGYAFLGQNLKRIGIIVNDPKHAFLPEAQLDFLTKILEACKMNLADVAILNHAKKEIIVENLKEQLKPNKVLLFGLDTTGIKLPFSIPEFKIQEYDQCSYLCAAPLEQLIQNNADGKAQKTKLWICLKEMFGV
jgi:hypothetical protein